MTAPTIIAGRRVTHWIAGRPEHPLLTLARSVETRALHGRAIGGNRPPDPDGRQRRLDRAAREVRVAATAHDPVPFDDQLRGLPMHGLTRARARLIRDALNGYPVRFWSANDRLHRRGDAGTLGVFLTIHLEGDWVWGSPLAAPYDILIATSWSERATGPACSGGSQRVLGPGALARLDVLAGDPWRVCERCFAWRPRTAVVDDARWMLDHRDLAAEYAPRHMCRQTGEGHCR